MSTGPIRVLCVDDHAFIAEGVETRLKLEINMQFVGWLESAETLLEAAERQRPNIVLLDIEMPGPDPFETISLLRDQHPECRVIVFSAYVRDHYIDAAVKAGAWGYLAKSDKPEAVVAAIRKVASGGFAFGPAVADRVQPSPSDRREGPAPAPSRLNQLSPRELQILRMMARGMSRIEIAEVIHRSPKTVDNHRASIMTKLGIHDRVELARFAISEGLVEL